MNTYKVKLVCRKDLESNWEEQDTTLLNGELGIATHIVNSEEVFKGIKVGEDKPWSDTAYIPMQSMEDTVAAVMNSFADSDTINFYYDTTDGKYKFEVIPVGATIIQTTYADLVVLRDTNKLINGVGYEFEYQTIHIIEHTEEINTGVPETIVVFANGLNTFATAALSRKYPFDELEYDIDDTGGALNRPGHITYRHDTLNGLSTHYDWRVYKFRRWNYDIPMYDINATYTFDWSKYDNTIMTTGSWIYMYGGEDKVPLTYAMDGYHNPANQWYLNPFWRILWASFWGRYIVHNPTSISLAMGKINANPTDWVDLHTFHTGLGVNPDGSCNPGLMKNIHIGKHSKPNNIIFRDYENNQGNGSGIHDNIIGVGSFDSTIIGNNIINNNYGTFFSNNLLSNSKDNKIETRMEYCCFGDEFHGNQIWNGCIRFMGWGTNYNVFHGGVNQVLLGPECSYNFSTSNLGNNSSGGRFTGNICMRGFSNNFLGTTADSNVFLSWFQNNTIRGHLAANVFRQHTANNYIYGYMKGCDFKHQFLNTTIGTDAPAERYNGIFYFNSFNGDVTASGGRRNYFATNSSYNVYNNYVKDVGTGTSVGTNKPGTPTIPYKTNNSIYHFAVDGVTMLDTSISVNRTIFNQELKSYSVIENLADTTVPKVKSGLSKIDFIFPEVSIDSSDEIYFNTNISIDTVTTSANINSVTYQVKVDGNTYIDKATPADVNTWILTLTEGTEYWIKAIQTRVTGGVDKGYHTFNLK